MNLFHESYSYYKLWNAFISRLQINWQINKWTNDRKINKHHSGSRIEFSSAPLSRSPGTQEGRRCREGTNANWRVYTISSRKEPRFSPGVWAENKSTSLDTLFCWDGAKARDLLTFARGWNSWGDGRLFHPRLDEGNPMRRLSSTPS